jgi:hypothetical protein
LEYEYLREFKTEFKNILECESGAHMGSINEKTRVKKSRATVPLSPSIAEEWDWRVVEYTRKTCRSVRCRLAAAEEKNGPLH